jgi:hypothetical protein
MLFSQLVMLSRSRQSNRDEDRQACVDGNERSHQGHYVGPVLVRVGYRISEVDGGLSVIDVTPRSDLNEGNCDKISKR